MKRMSLAVVAALAALAMTAAIGSTAASASVLCKTSASPCSSAYGVGTELSAGLVANARFRLKNGEMWSECSSGSIKVQVTDAGDSRPAKTKDVSYSLTGCTFPTSFNNAGSWEIAYSGSKNGKATDSGTVLTIKSFGINCEYKFPVESQLKGGSQAKLIANGDITTSNAGCPPTLAMEAEYEVNSPTPLYVAERLARPIVLCKTSEANCAVANRYGEGTEFAASLKSGTSLVLRDAEEEALNSCAASTLGGEVSFAGGVGSEVAAVDINTATAGSCTFPTTIEALSWESSIKRTEVLGNGTQKIYGFKVKVNTVFFGTCIYGGDPSFAVTGGAPAELSASGAALDRQSGSSLVCPSKAYLSATYALSAPSPLYLTAP